MHAGASVLVEGLIVSHGVLLLDLSANALRDDGAASLAVACSALPQLSRVRLAGNHFGEMPCRLRAQLACVVAWDIMGMHASVQYSGGRSLSMVLTRKGASARITVCMHASLCVQARRA